jgi:uncharacterized protein YlzI (FlbEa/FlbD family)
MALILRRDKGSVLTHNEVDDNFVYVDTTAVKLTGNQTIAGIKTFSSTMIGSISGNAGTVTNGVYIVGNQTIDGIKTFTSTVVGSISGNSETVTNGVYTINNQTIGGTKTFSSTIVGSVSGNSETVTNGVYLVGNQTIAGVKTFSSTITGSISGNCGTVTNGVYTIGDQTIAGIKTFSSTIIGSINGNSATVTNGVYTIGDQTIAGVKTFSSTIIGSINGNSATVTNGVYSVGDQTIAGIKTFSSAISGSINGNSTTVTNGVYTIGDQTLGGNKTFTLPIVGSITGNSATVTNGLYSNGSYTDPTWLTLTKTKVGLGSVDNTADASKNVLSATILTTSRTINGVGFDGSQNINIEERAGTSVASAVTTTIGTRGSGETVHITGTTGITSFGVSTTGTLRKVIFDGNVVLTYNATSLILPGAQNITTGSGDVMIIFCENGALGYWRVLSYLPATLDVSEMGYLNGVTSSIQTQINGKSPLVHTHLSADITDATSSNTSSRLVLRDASGNFSAGTITASLSGNATTASSVTNGVYTTGDQTIAGIKTFSGTVVQTPAATVVPATNGQMVFELTNNTTLTVRVKGSDGVVRSVALTLA